jgi:hypothetical protein
MFGVGEATVAGLTVWFVAVWLFDFLQAAGKRSSESRKAEMVKYLFI